MQKYKKNYFKHYGIGEQDIILCKICNAVAVDLHHIIFKSQGGTDNVNNLIPLCRSCHNKAHSNKIFNNSLHERRYK